MRKNMITLLLMTTIIASAQNVQKINEHYFQAKVSELVLRLEMTDSQKTKFLPVYRRYCEEMRQTVGVRQWPSKSLSDEERLELIKRKMQRQQQAQAIRIKYIEEFSRFLSVNQVSQFFEVESEIQKKLMERRRLRGRRP